jgi:hypothetical protein
LILVILGYWDTGILGYWDTGILGYWDTRNYMEEHSYIVKKTTDDVKRDT